MPDIVVYPYGPSKPVRIRWQSDTMPTDQDIEDIYASFAKGEVGKPAPSAPVNTGRIGDPNTTRIGPEPRSSGTSNDWEHLSSFAGVHGLTVTGKNEKQGHNVNSRHYIGQAIDVRVRDKSPEEVAAFIKAAQAKGIRVVDERTRPNGQAVWTGPHLHLEIGDRNAFFGQQGTPQPTPNAPITNPNIVRDRPAPKGIGFTPQDYPASKVPVTKKPNIPNQQVPITNPALQQFGQPNVAQQLQKSIDIKTPEGKANAKKAYKDQPSKLTVPTKGKATVQVQGNASGSFTIPGIGPVRWVQRGPGFVADVPGLGTVMAPDPQSLAKKIHQGFVDVSLKAKTPAASPNYAESEQQSQDFYTNQNQNLTAEERASAKARQARATAKDPMRMSLTNPASIIMGAGEHIPGMVATSAGPVLAMIGGATPEEMQFLARRQTVKQADANVAAQMVKYLIPGTMNAQWTADIAKGVVRSLDDLGKGKWETALTEIAGQAGLPAALHGLSYIKPLIRAWKKFRSGEGSLDAFIAATDKMGLDANRKAAVIDAIKSDPNLGFKGFTPEGKPIFSVKSDVGPVEQVAKVDHAAEIAAKKAELDARRAARKAETEGPLRQGQGIKVNGQQAEVVGVQGDTVTIRYQDGQVRDVKKSNLNAKPEPTPEATTQPVPTEPKPVSEPSVTAPKATKEPTAGVDGRRTMDVVRAEEEAIAKDKGLQQFIKEGESIESAADNAAIEHSKRLSSLRTTRDELIRQGRGRVTDVSGMGPKVGKRYLAENERILSEYNSVSAEIKKLEEANISIVGRHERNVRKAIVAHKLGSPRVILNGTPNAVAEMERSLKAHGFETERVGSQIGSDAVAIKSSTKVSSDAGKVAKPGPQAGSESGRSGQQISPDLREIKRTNATSPTPNTPKPESVTAPKATKEPVQNVTSGVKEPWQMTREELAKKQMEADNAPSQASGLYRDNIDGLNKQIDDHLAALSDGKILERNRRAGETLNQTRARVQQSLDYLNRNGHKAAVESALKEGKPVPPEVLADYPDLAAKYKQPTPKPESVTAPKATKEPLSPLEQEYSTYLNRMDSLAKEHNDVLSKGIQSGDLELRGKLHYPKTQAGESIMLKAKEISSEWESLRLEDSRWRWRLKYGNESNTGSSAGAGARSDIKAQDVQEPRGGPVSEATGNAGTQPVRTGDQLHSGNQGTREGNRVTNKGGRADVVVPENGSGQRISRVARLGKEEADWVDAVNNASTPIVTRITSRGGKRAEQYVVTDGGKEIARINTSKVSYATRTQLNIGDIVHSDEFAVHRRVNFKQPTPNTPKPVEAPQKPVQAAEAGDVKPTVESIIQQQKDFEGKIPSVAEKLDTEGKAAYRVEGGNTIWVLARDGKKEYFVPLDRQSMSPTPLARAKAKGEAILSERFGEASDRIKPINKSAEARRQSKLDARAAEDSAVKTKYEQQQSEAIAKQIARQSALEKTQRRKVEIAIGETGKKSQIAPTYKGLAATKETDGRGFVVTHIGSGKAVTRGYKTVDDAIVAMTRAADELGLDFTKSADDLMASATKSQRDSLGALGIDPYTKLSAPSKLSTVNSEIEAVKARRDARLKVTTTKGTKQRGSADFTKDDFNDALELAELYVKKAGLTFEQYAKEMVDYFGDGVKPHLKEIWDTHAPVKAVPKVSAPKVETNGEDVTGVAKQVTGRDPMKGASKVEMAERGRQIIEKDINAVANAIDAVEKKGVPMTPDEVSAAGYRLRQIENKQSEIRAAIEKTNDSAELASLNNLQQGLELEVERILKATDYSLNVGFHQYGMAAQIAYKPDFSLAALKSRAKGALLGTVEVVPKHIETKLASYASTIDQLRADLEAARKQIGDLIHKGSYKRGTKESNVKRLRQFFGEDGGAYQPMGSKSSKQRGAIYTLPNEERDAMAAMRSLAKQLADEGAGSLDEIVSGIRKEIGKNIPEETIYRMLSDKYRKYLLESDVQRMDANRYLRDIQRAAEFKLRTPLEKAVEATSDILGATARSLQAGWDISAPFIQGRKGLIANPVGWMKSWESQLKALKTGDAVVSERLAEMERHPLYPRFVAAGGDKLMRRPGGVFHAQEEVFGTNFMRLASDTMSNAGPIGKYNPVNLYLKGLEHSDAAFSAFMNDLTWDTFVKFAKANPSDPAFLRDTVANLGIIYGRGTGPVAEAIGRSKMGNYFYAPRYTLSQMQYAGTPIRVMNPGSYETTAGRMQALRTYGTQAVAYGTLVAIAKLNGWDIETDLRSSDFGTVALPGGRRLDIFGKESQAYRLVANIFAGRVTKKNEYEKPGIVTAWKSVGQFVFGKLAPGPRLPSDVLFGSFDPDKGATPFTMAEFGKRYLPLWVQQTLQNGDMATIPMAILGQDVSKDQKAKLIPEQRSKSHPMELPKIKGKPDPLGRPYDPKAQVNDGDVIKEVQRLGIELKWPDTAEGETEAEYKTRAQKQGDAVRDAIRSQMATSLYKNATITEKREMVKSEISATKRTFNKDFNEAEKTRKADERLKQIERELATGRK